MLSPPLPLPIYTVYHLFSLVLYYQNIKVITEHHLVFNLINLKLSCALSLPFSLESLWNHGLTIIRVSSLSSRIMGLTYDYTVDMSGAGSNLLAGAWVLWAR